MKRQKLTKEQKKYRQYLEALKSYKRTKWLTFFRFVFSMVITGLCTLLGWLLTDKFGATVVSAMEKAGIAQLLIIAFIIFLLVLFFLIFFGLRWSDETDETFAIVWLSILSVLVVLLSPFVLYFLYFIVKTFGIATIKIKDYWMLYMVPCVIYAGSAVSYVLLTIKRRGGLTWKVKLSAGIGSLIAIITTLTVMILFFQKNGWNGKAEGSLLRILCLISAVLSGGILVSSVRVFDLYGAPNVSVYTESMWISGAIIGSITSVAGILAAVILIIFLIVAGSSAQMMSQLNKTTSCQRTINSMPSDTEDMVEVREYKGGTWTNTRHVKKGTVITTEDGVNRRV